MKGIIYKYTLPDGKVYIGQTRRPLIMRHSEHLSPTTGPLNPGFWEAYQRVGTPILTTLETIESDNQTELVHLLNREETRYITREKATDPEYGYNRRMIATTHSPEISFLKTEYARLCQIVENEKRPFFDVLTEKLLHHNEANLTDEERAFVEAYIDNNNIFTHDSENNPMIHEEEECFDDEEDFMYCEAIDYAIWLYFEETNEIIARYISEKADVILERARQSKIIQQLDKTGSVVREFESHDAIREAFNIVRMDNIINVLKGRQKTAYGFRWRYKPIEK